MKKLLLLLVNGVVAISINWILLSNVPFMCKLWKTAVSNPWGVVSRFHENENKNSNFVLQGLK